MAPLLPRQAQGGDQRPRSPPGQVERVVLAAAEAEPARDAVGGGGQHCLGGAGRPDARLLHCAVLHYHRLLCPQGPDPRRGLQVGGRLRGDRGGHAAGQPGAAGVLLSHGGQAGPPRAHAQPHRPHAPGAGVVRRGRARQQRGVVQAGQRRGGGARRRGRPAGPPGPESGHRHRRIHHCFRVRMEDDTGHSGHRATHGCRGLLPGGVHDGLQLTGR
mmetsp:Transcript_8356/g.25029  ORF Transcript_8356/g.25029 Transcript_8356/m.25029 type:complete len:216 (+) Transcript_8356:2265-2912(+)